ncbi:hypothetical protein V8F33_013386 [Rhypophila sp. PSN 637]
MPVPIAAKAGIIAVAAAVAAAIAIYESPEIRRAAEDIRRRIAIALHSLGENIDPQQQPIFNRPEDAEGFLESRGSLGADQGVDADEETRRRQREELMYWNAQLEAKKAGESTRAHRRTTSRGSSFDDFMREDKTANERGTFVFNTGADLSGGNSADQQLSKRRGFTQGVRGLNASMIANPFADEYGIELDEQHPQDIEAEKESKRLLTPDHDEVMGDIYNATPRGGQSVASENFQTKPEVPEVLFDFDAHSRSQSATLEQASIQSTTSRSVTLDRELDDDEFMTAGQEDRADAYASIQAWAQGSTGSTGFYSPLPESPAAPLSEPEVVSTGDLTPTDSISLTGSGEDVGNDAASSKNGDNFDVMSQDSDDGMATPSSWSEVGSTISDEENAMHA